MKKIIIALCILVALSSIAGILYGTQGKSDEEETMTLEQVYQSQFPVQMPDVIINPEIGIPLH